MSEERPPAKHHHEFGYLEDGTPTDTQLRLQDVIDGITQQYLNKMREAYALASGINIPIVEHDIGKLTRLREEAEDVLELPDIY